MSELLPNRGRAALRAALYLLSTMAVFALVSGLMPKTLGSQRDLASMALAAVLTFLLTLLFTRWDHIAPADVGASVSTHTLPRLLAGFLLGIVMLAVQNLALLASGHVHWQRDPSIGVAPIALAFALYLAVALREELAYRGYPLRRLDSAFGPWTAQLVIAAIFSFEHIIGGYSLTDALLGVTLASLLFGAASLLTRGLALPMGIHLAWNFGQWILGGKKTPGPWRLLVDPGYDHSAYIVGMAGYLIAFAGAFAVLWLLRSRLAARR